MSNFHSITLSLFFLFQCLFVDAQIEFSTKKIDLGSVEKGDSTYVDISLINVGDETDYFLSIRNAENILYKISSQKFNPGEGGVLRIMYVPKKQGSFNESIDIYFGNSNKPYEFTIKGVINYYDASIAYNCPDFNPYTTHEANINNFKLLVEVRDSISNEPIAEANVQIWTLNTERMQSITGASGEAKFKINPGRYIIQVDGEQYNPFQTDKYFNKDKNTILIKLSRKEIEETPEEVAPKPPIQEIVKSQNTQYPLLPEDEYKPNNIVFLMDVSGSMRKEEKIEIMKEGMLELLQILRPIDKFSLITYSGEPKILLEGISGGNKELIRTQINELEAGGSTAGNKAIKKAYQIANNHFIDDGNNLIIVATDGAFRENTYKVIPIVKWNHQSAKQSEEKASSEFVVAEGCVFVPQRFQTEPYEP